MQAHFQDLKGKKVLVTGALRGIGRGVACALASNGAHVVLGYRSRPEKAQELCEALRSLGAEEAHPLRFDVSEYAQVKEALEGYVKEHGPLSGVVNNAGLSRDTLLLRLKEEEIHTLIDTNLKGSLYVIQALSRSLLKSSEVSIVNISSVIGLMGNSGQTAYAAAKAGILGMSKSVAKELGGRGIRCNAICPGFIETDMTKALDPKTKELYCSQIPLKRFGHTEDVSNLVLFLISQASSYITGEVIKIDGGIYI
ncbi:MAG: SDR family NAD(P)-dependent oxidoreductase [Bacteriovoracales bacterium]|nr:SDR family NAD(P)-dependent oxidoreductase [Bacteriovoracales bacterium]